MKRLSANLFLICLVFLSACSPSIKNIDSQGKAIVCLGDSITYGVGSDEGGDYPSSLKQILGEDVINSGVPGDTSAGMLNRLETDVIEHNPYLVIIEIGGNDFLNNVPEDETLKNIERAIDRIQGKGAIVALCDISSSFIFRKYKDGYKKLAKRTKSVFVPGLLTGILENPSLKYDQIHPNSQGYNIIAQRIYKAIKPYIK